MNSISKMIKAKSISFCDMLVRNFLVLGLSEKEVVILMLLYINQDNGQILCSASISSKVTLSPLEVEETLINLIQKGFITLDIDNDGHEYYSLDLLIEKLGDIIEDEDKVSNQDFILQSIIDYAEVTYAKNLSMNDTMIIKEWLKESYSEEEMKEAILDSLKAKKAHLRYADSILINSKKAKKVSNVMSDEDALILKSLYGKK